MHRHQKRVDYGYGLYAWKMSLYSYVKEDIRNVIKHKKDKKMEFNKKLSEINYLTNNIFYAVEYIPELENSAEYTEDQFNFFQNLIGELNWIVYLGRIYISLEVSSISKLLLNPRSVHLIQSLHVFKYL